MFLNFLGVRNIRFLDTISDIVCLQVQLYYIVIIDICNYLCFKRRVSGSFKRYLNRVAILVPRYYDRRYRNFKIKYKIFNISGKWFILCCFQVCSAIRGKKRNFPFSRNGSIMCKRQVYINEMKDISSFWYYENSVYCKLVWHGGSAHISVSKCHSKQEYRYESSLVVSPA